MAKLDGGLMERKLKAGWVRKDFAKLFEVSEEQFEEMLKREFDKNAYKAMMLRISRNEKKRQKPRKQKTTNDMRVEEKIEEKVQSSPQEELETLEADKKILEEQLCSFEKDRKQLLTKKHSIESNLQKYQDILIGLRKKVEENMNKAAEQIDALQEVSDSIRSVNEQMKLSKSEIVAIDEKISSLKVMQIFVYNNGTIEVDSNIVEIDGWENIFKQISSDLKFEDLTLKQIKQFAKLVIFTSSQTRSFEIVFENEAMEKLFREF